MDKYLREEDSYEDFENTTKTKPYKQEFWAAFQFNPNSKMVKYWCSGKCKQHVDHDKRQLIKGAYQKGYRRCLKCGYFKTKELIKCPCCNQRLRYKNRQKNHPHKKYKNNDLKEY